VIGGGGRKRGIIDWVKGKRGGEVDDYLWRRWRNAEPCREHGHVSGGFSVKKARVRRVGGAAITKIMGGGGVRVGTLLIFIRGAGLREKKGAEEGDARDL